MTALPTLILGGLMAIVQQDRSPEALFKRLDRDGDGKISKQEIPERIRERFAIVDRDSDGAISLEEFRAARNRIRPGSPAEQNQTRRNPDRNDRRPSQTAESVSAPLFQILDRNRDGKLSEAEINAAADLLQRMDRNQDGFVAIDELTSGGPAERRPPSKRLGQPVQSEDYYERLFGRMDQDGNRKLEGDEIPRFLRARLERLDANNDGVLEVSELKRAAGRQPRTDTSPDKPPSAGQFENMLSRIDRNGDGKVTRDELPRFLADRFNRLDANGNGLLDASELAQMRDRAAQRSGDRASARPGNRPNPANVREYRDQIAKLLRDQDKDGDGQLSKEEASSDLADRFDGIDQDRDGFLNPSEITRFLSNPGRRPK